MTREWDEQFDHHDTDESDYCPACLNLKGEHNLLKETKELYGADADGNRGIWIFGVECTTCGWEGGDPIPDPPDEDEEEPAMNYNDVLAIATELDLHHSHVMCKTKNGRQYLKLKLKQSGRNMALDELFRRVEAVVGTKRTFSHNPVRSTATVALYDTEGEEVSPSTDS